MPGNSVLRRILGPKKDKITEVWIKLQNEVLRNLCPLSYALRMVKTRRMR
jgi:hypothetical protein